MKEGHKERGLVLARLGGEFHQFQELLLLFSAWSFLVTSLVMLKSDIPSQRSHTSNSGISSTFSFVNPLLKKEFKVVALSWSVLVFDPSGRFNLGIDVQIFQFFLHITEEDFWIQFGAFLLVWPFHSFELRICKPTLLDFLPWPICLLLPLYSCIFCVRPISSLL